MTREASDQPEDVPLRVLFCDDSGGALRGFQKEVATPLGQLLEARTASSLEGFEALCEQGEGFDVVISDLNFEQVGGGPKDGLLLLARAKRAWPDAQLVLVTAFAGSLEVTEVLELAGSGLSPQDLFRKTEGDDPGALWARLRERLSGIAQSRRQLSPQLATLERAGFFHRTRAREDSILRLAAETVVDSAAAIRADANRCQHGIVAQSFAMRELLARLERAARRQSDVLILGETGTGKELIARALHASSPRHAQAFVKTDLASLSSDLIPAELFGHEKGAFTGADRRRQGLVAEADGGILFLDEIGNLSSAVQAGLLRILEDRTYRPLGASRDANLDAVMVAATHADLEQEVAEGRFRADLLERLYVVPLRLPPLRERREDIPLLAVCFLADLRERFAVSGFQHLDGAALERLSRHPWPRNVRQLRNTIERLFSELDDDTPRITVAHIDAVMPPEPFERPASSTSLSRRALDGELGLTLAQIARQHGEDAVREVIHDTFLELGGPPDQAAAAQLFGGMKANTWRQFAFKRGLTYRVVRRSPS